MLKHGKWIHRERPFIPLGSHGSLRWGYFWSAPGIITQWKQLNWHSCKWWLFFKFAHHSAQLFKTWGCFHGKVVPQHVLQKIGNVLQNWNTWEIQIRIQCRRNMIQILSKYVRIIEKCACFVVSKSLIFYYHSKVHSMVSFLSFGLLRKTEYHRNWFCIEKYRDLDPWSKCWSASSWSWSCGCSW